MHAYFQHIFKKLCLLYGAKGLLCCLCVALLLFVPALCLAQSSVSFSPGPGNVGWYHFGTGGQNTLNATNGRVIANNLTASWWLAGSYAHNIRADAMADNSSVSVYGSGQLLGLASGYAYSARTSATVSANKVFIDGGVLNIPEIYGGYADGYSAYANENMVQINNGTFSNAKIYGGKAYGNITTALRNRVDINGGNFSDSTVYGGYSDGYQAETRENTVHISNGNFAGTKIYGAYSLLRVSSGSANTVHISGGNFINSFIYGSYTYGTRSENFDNTVIISGNPRFDGTGIYGSLSDCSVSKDSNNTLEIRSDNLTLKNIYNFQNYHFYLPQTVRNNTVILRLTDTSGTNISNSNIGVAVAANATPLREGERVILINNANGLNSTGYKQISLSAKQGVSLSYDFTLNADNNSLYALVSSAPNLVNNAADKPAKALSEGFIGGGVLATLGGDLTAGPGMESALKSANAPGSGQSKSASGVAGGAVASFGAISGGSVRYHTGSHVDMKSISLMAGLARAFSTVYGQLLMGLFFEYGNGSYDTYNSFNNASVRGNGRSRYGGGGLLARMHFGQFYVEGSGRVGALHNEYQSTDLRDAATGLGVDYESNSPYTGLHGGLGYVLDIGERSSLDMHGKYFWTRQGGDNTTLSNGEHLEFAAINSHRLRLGARLSHSFNDYFVPYIGASYEHEFDLESRGKINGFDIEAPNLKGDSGIGELGIAFTPSATLPLTLELGLQGYTGKREGVSGSLQMRLEF